MTTENKPISGLYPLPGLLTPGDLMVISQELPEGWQSYHVPVSKFVDLVIRGMNDGSVFLRKVHTVDDSGLLGTGTIIDAMGIDFVKLDARYAPSNVGNGYVPRSTQIVAGIGLAGGGALDANRTLELGVPSTITASTNNSVSAATHTHAIDPASTSAAGVVKLVDNVISTSVTEAVTARVAKLLNDTKVDKTIVVTAGNGLTGGGALNGNVSVALGLPATLGEASTNAVAGTSHSHAIETATTARAGIVKLNDTVTSNSVTEAATAKSVKGLSDTKADKTVAFNVGWGLTGGGNLAATRQIDLNLDQLDTRYASAAVGGSYVPLTRTVNAGTGLTGGGALSNNITLSINFGSTINTVAMGNDNRINNGQTAYTWGNHATQNYMKLNQTAAGGGLLGNGTAGSPMSVDFGNLDARYLSKNGGVINGDLTVTGNLNAPGMDTGILLGTIIWWNGPRNAVPDGYVTLDGQIANRTDFPDLWTMINSGRLNRVAEQSWQEIASGSGTRLNWRSSFSTGNGSTTFRFPDLNGIQANSLKSPVLRGDGFRELAYDSVSSGHIFADAIRDIQGMGGWSEAANGYEAGRVQGAFYLDTTRGWFGVGGARDSDNAALGFAASRVVPTASENRPVSAFGVYIMKARGGTGSIPAAGSPATLLANTFNGSQKIVGNLEVTGTETVKDLVVTGSFNLSGNQKLPGTALASCNFNGVTNTFRYSDGIASITHLGNGLFEGVLNNPMPDANYAVLAIPSNHAYWSGSGCSATVAGEFVQTTTRFRVRVCFGGDNTQGPYIPTVLNIAIFR